MGNWFSKEEKEEIVIAQATNTGVPTASTLSKSQTAELILAGILAALIFRMIYRFLRKKMVKEIRRQINQSTANIADCGV